MVKNLTQEILEKLVGQEIKTIKTDKVVDTVKIEFVTGEDFQIEYGYEFVPNTIDELKYFLEYYFYTNPNDTFDYSTVIVINSKIVTVEYDDCNNNITFTFENGKTVHIELESEWKYGEYDYYFSVEEINFDEL